MSPLRSLQKRTLRCIAGLLFFGAILAVAVSRWPLTEKDRAIRTLERAGFTWNDGSITDPRPEPFLPALFEVHSEGFGADITSLKPLAPALRLLQPTSFYLFSCRALQNVDGLEGLNSLECLKLYKCHSLQMWMASRA